MVDLPTSIRSIFWLSSGLEYERLPGSQQIQLSIFFQGYVPKSSTDYLYPNPINLLEIIRILNSPDQLLKGLLSTL